MKRVFCLFALLGVAACGVDGEPVQPTANIAIGVGSGGVHAGGSIGVSSGPLTVGVGVF